MASTENGANKNERMNLDKILIEEIGQFGKYQLKLVCLAAVVVIFAAWGAVEYVFTTGRINSRCYIPNCDSANPEFTPSWITSAIPSTNGAFDNCNRYDNVTALPEDGTCPAQSFDMNLIVPCESYVYENTNTVAYDYDLACDEWKRTLIGSVRTFGTLTALPITGFISDRWGRKVALIFNAFNTAWMGVTRYWADTYIGFLISEFVEATFGSGGFSTAYILVMEVMGPKYRVAGGATMNTFFAIGQVTMALVAWGVPNWKNLTLALYIPQFLVIAYFWLISESVRWYLSKERYSDAEDILQKIARTNGRELSPKSLQELRMSAEAEKRERETVVKEKSELLIKLVFRHKRVLLICVVSPIWWITNTFIYYGLSINSVNMSGNPYLNYMAVSAVEIPGYWAAVLLLNVVGRKPVLIGAFWTCAACQIAYIFMPNDLYAVSLTVYLIGKFSIAMVMTSVYVYTAELYPTKYRHSLFAFSSMMGRIGSVLAPLTPAFGTATFNELPFVLFGGMALLAGALMFFTPETLNTKMPDTMEEANNLGLKKKSAA